MALLLWHSQPAGEVLRIGRHRLTVQIQIVDGLPKEQDSGHFSKLSISVMLAWIASRCTQYGAYALSLAGSEYLRGLG